MIALLGLPEKPIIPEMVTSAKAMSAKAMLAKAMLAVFALISLDNV
jgi:hypothetical protein